MVPFFLSFGFGLGLRVWVWWDGTYLLHLQEAWLQAGIWDGKVGAWLNPAGHLGCVLYKISSFGPGITLRYNTPLAGRFVGYGMDWLLVSHKERAGRAIAVIHVRYLPYFAFS